MNFAIGLSGLRGRPFFAGFYELILAPAEPEPRLLLARVTRVRAAICRIGHLRRTPG